MVYEPGLFEHVAWSAQTLFRDRDAALDAGGTLLLVSGADLPALGVGVGSVLKLAELGLCEVADASGSNQLTVSRLRAEPDGPAVPVSAGAWAGKASCGTFAPQIGAVHRTLLRALGVEPGQAPPDTDANDDTVFASQILNGHELAEVEALGALHLILAGAAALAAPSSPMWVRAEHYRKRFHEARAVVGASIDLDGDGEPEVLRRINVMRLVRH